MYYVECGGCFFDLDDVIFVGDVRSYGDEETNGYWEFEIYLQHGEQGNYVEPRFADEKEAKFFHAELIEMKKARIKKIYGEFHSYN